MATKSANNSGRGQPLEEYIQDMKKSGKLQDYLTALKQSGTMRDYLESLKRSGTIDEYLQILEEEKGENDDNETEDVCKKETVQEKPKKKDSLHVTDVYYEPEGPRRIRRTGDTWPRRREADRDRSKSMVITVRDKPPAGAGHRRVRSMTLGGSLPVRDEFPERRLSQVSQDEQVEECEIERTSFKDKYKLRDKTIECQIERRIYVVKRTISEPEESPNASRTTSPIGSSGSSLRSSGSPLRSCGSPLRTCGSPVPIGGPGVRDSGSRGSMSPATPGSLSPPRATLSPTEDRGKMDAVLSMPIYSMPIYSIAFLAGQIDVPSMES